MPCGATTATAPARPRAFALLHCPHLSLSMSGPCSISSSIFFFPLFFSFPPTEVKQSPHHSWFVPDPLHSHLYRPLSLLLSFTSSPQGCHRRIAILRPLSGPSLPDLFVLTTRTEFPSNLDTSTPQVICILSPSTLVTSYSATRKTSHRHAVAITITTATTSSPAPTSMSAVRATALRAGGACVRCRKGKTKCVYENGRAPCKNCAKGMHECYLPSESMSHGGHGVSPARTAQRVRESLPTEKPTGPGAHADRHAQSHHSTSVTSRTSAPANEKYVLSPYVLCFMFLRIASPAITNTITTTAMESSPASLNHMHTHNLADRARHMDAVCC